MTVNFHILKGSVRHLVIEVVMESTTLLQRNNILEIEQMATADCFSKPWSIVFGGTHCRLKSYILTKPTYIQQ